jgi:hypothetical protein
MKKLILLFAVLFLNLQLICSQVVGTPYIISEDNRLLLDQFGINPSFAFSSRKLREAYTGFSVRIRRSTDNAEADVSFDNTSVTDNSIATLAVVGTSGLTIGSTMLLSNFSNGATIYVTIWYDQGTNGFNAIQTVASKQPVFKMNSNGVSNSMPSIGFTGSLKHHLIVNQTLSVLLTNSLKGTLGFIAKPATPSSINNSLGYFDPANSSNRWSCHLNWSDGNCYTDLGNSSDLNRAFSNAANENSNKQYLILRNTNSKTTKVSGVFKQNNVALNLTSPLTTGGAFGIGLSYGSSVNATDNGYNGDFSEFILFNDALNATQINTLENNQIKFWNTY